tara:strand:- start:884 stop:1117 length:234 start_codon:yes stop_codon:yes gene_type:complete
MKKNLFHQDQDNNHYQIEGFENIFFLHHLGKDRNPKWERVTIVVVNKEDPENIAPNNFQFSGIGCVNQANKKLQELV